MKNKLLLLVRKNKYTIFSSIFFLFFQILYTVLLFHRQENMAVSSDDYYGYIFVIKKVSLFSSIFPAVPALTRSFNFDYLSYSVIFGGISKLFKIPAELLFISSFYWGKVILLFGIVYLLKTIKFNDKLTALVTLALAIYSGNGATHGFFWVVPSFWLYVILLFLIGIVLNPKKVSIIPIIILTLIFTTMHQLFFPLLIFWFLLIFSLKIYHKSLSLFPNAIKTLICLTLSALLFQGTQYLYIHYENNQQYFINRFFHAKTLNTTDVTNLVETDKKIAIIPIPIQNKLYKPHTTNDIKKTNTFNESFDFGSVLHKLTSVIPSVTTYWQTIASPLLPIYPVFIWLPWWIHLIFENQNKSIKTYLLIYFSAVTTSVLFVWHTFGFRILPLPISLSYGFIGITIYLSAIRTETKFITKLINKSGIIICLFLLVYYGWLNLTSIISYAKTNQYNWQPEKCVDYITSNIDNYDSRIFFNSRTGLSSFMANGLHKFPLTPYLGPESIKINEYVDQNKDIFLISESTEITTTDVPYTNEGVNSLKERLANRKIIVVDCGYFILTRFIKN